MNTESHLFFRFLNVACPDVWVTEVSDVIFSGSRKLSSSSSVALTLKGDGFPDLVKAQTMRGIAVSILPRV